MPESAARMVEVGAKPDTERVAEAVASVSMSPATLKRVLAGEVAKGDVMAVAQVAGILAAKRTPELLPLCHPLLLTGVEVTLEPEPDGGGLKVRSRVTCVGKTGAEMEALTAAAVAGLTVYDMLKQYDRGLSVGPVRLLSKRGGKSGDWRAAE
jgi:cyclic pyranopterin phosphate synthase